MTLPKSSLDLANLEPQWIVLEGIDGAGTTTQAQLLSDHLRGAGCRVHMTCEPSTGAIGVLTRRALRKEFANHIGERLRPEIVALLFAADRAHHVYDEVHPALQRGEWVICDRYVHSSLAYQGNELPMEWVAEINSRVPDADTTVFLDTPVDICLSRIDSRGGEREIYEERGILQGVRERYLEAFAIRSTGVTQISGDRAIEAVLHAVMSAAGLRESL